MDHLIRRFNDCIAVDMVILVIFHSKLTFAALQHTFPAYPMSFSSHHWWNHVKSHQSFLDESAGDCPHEIHHRNWPWSCSIWPRSGRALLHLLKFVADPCGSSIPRLTMTSMTCQGPMGLKPSNYGIFSCGLWHCGTGLYELRENPSKPVEPSGKSTKMAEWVYAKMARLVYNTSGFELLENRTHKMVQWVYN